MAAPEPASRRLLLWFAATTVPATLALVWLGWFVVQQDRLLAHDRQRTEREQAADVGVAALARTLAEFESALVLAESATKAEHSPPFLAHTPILVFDTKGVVTRAGLLLPYSPAVSRTTVSLPESFARADNLEFVMGDARGAVRVVLPFSRDGRPAVQTEAWLRLARNYRKMGDVDRALSAYQALSSFDDATVQGLPAGLMGHTGRALLLAGTKQTRELREEAAALSADLAAGRWRLTQSQFEYHTSLAVGWLGPDAAGAVSHPGAAHAPLLAAAAAAWREGLDTRAQDARPRRVIRVNGASILVLRRPVSQGTAVMLVGAQVLGDAWQGNLPATIHAVDFALSDPAGEPFLGSPGTDPSRRATRNLMTSGLSWVLTADSSEAVSPVSLSASARLMLGGVTLMLLVAVLSGYVIIRALSREMRVTRLQTAFVAAVSHEFRTPLTTIRQFSEMLARSRVSSDERRQEFYEAILGESERLRRLVESLLDFGRMEAGQMAHKAESVDLDSLVDDISSSVRRDAASTGHDIDVDHEGGTPFVAGDRDALGCAIRNLLDNAVKYSPAHKTIDVSVGTQKGRVSIRVRDRGVGIPVAEQHEIFNKFVRGASAAASHIAGTGLGLAMARQIVEAHHGTISVQSAPGEGSTFTINLPAQEGAVPQ